MAFSDRRGFEIAHLVNRPWVYASRVSVTMDARQCGRWAFDSATFAGSAAKAVVAVPEVVRTGEEVRRT